MGHRVKATIDIEFEMADGQPEAAARAAVMRLRGDIHHSIAFGTGGLPTGVRRDSVIVQIDDAEIDGTPIL